MQKVTIEPGHATYEQLQNPTPPLWKSFYFFNLTNPKEFEEGSEVPKLEEKGPYSYRYTVWCFPVPTYLYTLPLGVWM